MSTHPWMARSPVCADATLAIDAAAQPPQGSADPASAYTRPAHPWLAQYEQGVLATVTLPDLSLVQLQPAPALPPPMQRRGYSRTHHGLCH